MSNAQADRLGRPAISLFGRTVAAEARALAAEARVTELEEVVRFAADIRWEELAYGSPFTAVDRVLLSELFGKARAAIAKA